MKKAQILGGILLIAGIPLFIILDWPLAWVAVLMILAGIGLLASPFFSGRKLSQRKDMGGVIPMKAGGMDARTAKYRGPTVPVIYLFNGGHSMDFLGYLPVDQGIILDPERQHGYEIQSNPVEIFVNSVSQGMGYIVDSIGVTVDLKRKVDIKDPKSAHGIMDLPDDFIVEQPSGGTTTIHYKSHTDEEKSFEVKNTDLKVHAYATFEGIIGTITSVKVIQNAIGFEPGSRTLLINRIVFSFVGGFAIWRIALPLLHI
jgi:hypothetical protein